MNFTGMEIIREYFPDIDGQRLHRFSMMEGIYVEWNTKINVISRKDMEMFNEHHVLHSLAIAKYLKFRPGSNIIDVGTGGGFPGIPLAIYFPEVQFTLIDSIGKKIKVVNVVIQALGLDNVTAMQTRSEEFKGKFDFILNRAVSSLPEFVGQTRHLVSRKQQNAITNGILCLKGGDLTAEINQFGKTVSVTNLDSYFKEPYFATKKLVHLSLL